MDSRPRAETLLWGAAMSDLLLVPLRGIVAFAILFLLTRLEGKKLISQLTYFDFVVGITIGSIAAAATTDVDTLEMVPSMLGQFVWAAGAWVLGWAAVHSLRWNKVIQGEPTVLVQNGKILEQNMRKLRYTIDDLRMQLRQKGAFNLSDVEFAILEPDGTLSVLKKSQLLPVTPQDLNLSTAYKGVPTELVVNGRVLEQNLEQVGLSRQWLLDTLRRQGIQDVRDVFYAELDTSGALYVSPYQNRPARPLDITDFADQIG